MLRDAHAARLARRARAAGVPCGPINRIDQVFADPQVVARGMRVDLPHPLAGTVPQVGNAGPLLGDAASRYDRAPPLLGEHTAEVLRERLGFADATIAELAAAGRRRRPLTSPQRAPRGGYGTLTQ